MERLRLDMDFLRQLARRPRPLQQAIGETELCRDMDELGDAKAHDELSQCCRRSCRRWPGVKTGIAHVTSPRC
jgi:hypothetical protein